MLCSPVSGYHSFEGRYCLNLHSHLENVFNNLPSHMASKCRSLQYESSLLYKIIILYTYCGVFTPCKDCNVITRSHDYATVEEAVFSLCQAELSSAVSRSLLGDTVNAWMTQEWRRVTWPLQWRNSRKVVFFRASDQGFTGDWSLFTSSSRWETTAGDS
jgi:hypothetical protein